MSNCIEQVKNLLNSNVLDFGNIRKGVVYCVWNGKEMKNYVDIENFMSLLMIANNIRKC